MFHSTAPFTADHAAKFGAIYPSQSGVFSHALVDHPLLTLDALADAATRMNADHVECRSSSSRNGHGFAMEERGPRAASDIIHNIASAGCWVMLRFADQLPDYKALLDDTLAGLVPIIERQTGPTFQRQAFIFISSPGTLTPFHFDPEYNILFQIAGQKNFAVYPSSAPWLSDEQNEQFHRSGDNLLSWQDSFEQQGSINALSPGDALFVPFKSPHWVRVTGDAPSISLSLTWRSAWGLAQDDAYLMNGWLRRFGVSPTTPPAWPQTSRTKSWGWKLIRRAGLSGLRA